MRQATLTRNDYGHFQREVRVTCDSCQMLRINGHPSHEHGCPDAWRDDSRECKWCGQEFTPESRRQDCCSEDCAEPYCS
jgi:hypothetical protein